MSNQSKKKNAMATDADLRRSHNVYVILVDGNATYAKSILSHEDVLEVRVTDYDWNVLHLITWWAKNEYAEHILSYAHGKLMLDDRDYVFMVYSLHYESLGFQSYGRTGKHHFIWPVSRKTSGFFCFISKKEGFSSTKTMYFSVLT